MNKLIRILLACTLLIAITACSPKEDVKKESNIPVEDSREDISPSTQTSESFVPNLEENNPIDELDSFELPKMSDIHQQMYDKYLYSLIPSGVFLGDFTSGSFPDFETSWVYSCLVESREIQHIPQEEVETVVAQYFPVTPAEMRIGTLHDYEEENETYIVPKYEPDSQMRGIVTAVHQQDDLMEIVCDWYVSNTPDDPVGSFEKLCTSVTLINPEINVYLSNQVQLYSMQ